MPQLPGLLRRALKGPFRSFERWRLRGDRIVCPVCGGHFDRLLPRWGHPNRQCPACHSLVRHRALWLLLHDELQIVERRPRILHFAPERGIARRIRATGADYVTGDIAARDPAERIDITRIPFPDASFDLAICSHVLEHVPDDRAAISELRRVRTGDIETRELDDTKNYLIGSFPSTVQTASDVAGRLMDIELYGLNDDYFDHYRENIAAVTKEDVERVAQKYLDPDRVLIVVVGNAKDIREPLGTLGMPMHELDIEGNAVAIA